LKGERVCVEGTTKHMGEVGDITRYVNLASHFELRDSKLKADLIKSTETMTPVHIPCRFFVGIWSWNSSPDASEDVAIVKLFNFDSIAYRKKKMSVFRNSNFMSLGARVVNTLFVHDKIPLAVLPRSSQINDKGLRPPSGPNDFYLVTECMDVIVVANEGFAVIDIGDAVYCVVSSSIQNDDCAMVVDSRGIMLKNEKHDECVSLLWK
jgi:hypothetical protein